MQTIPLEKPHRVSGISRALKAVGASLERKGGPATESGIVVRPVQDESELDEVYRITHDACVERGYCKPKADGRLLYYPHLDRIPETTVWAALAEGRIVGTISLTLDGPLGLHVDKDFKAECDRIRLEGRRMAGSWRIMTRKSCRSETAVVLELIKAVLGCCLEKGIETCVFIFNPRHERIYRRLLRFKTVARKEATATEELQSSLVFMRCDREELPAWCRSADAKQIKGQD